MSAWEKEAQTYSWKPRTPSRSWPLADLVAPARLSVALPVAVVVYLVLFRFTAPRHFRELFEHAGSAVPPLRRLLAKAQRSRGADAGEVEAERPGAATPS